MRRSDCWRGVIRHHKTVLVAACSRQVRGFVGFVDVGGAREGGGVRRSGSHGDAEVLVKGARGSDSHKRGAPLVVPARVTQRKRSVLASRHRQKRAAPRKSPVDCSLTYRINDTRERG